MIKAGNVSSNFISVVFGGTIITLLLSFWVPYEERVASIFGKETAVDKFGEISPVLYFFLSLKYSANIRTDQTALALILQMFLSATDIGTHQTVLVSTEMFLFKGPKRLIRETENIHSKPFGFNFLVE